MQCSMKLNFRFSRMLKKAAFGFVSLRSCLGMGVSGTLDGGGCDNAFLSIPVRLIEDLTSGSVY
jgi:hypothetical protein